MNEPTQRQLTSGIPQSKWGQKVRERHDKSSFDTAVVFDVISNPVEYFNIKFKEEGDAVKTLRDMMRDDTSGRGVTNAEILDLIPRNTILAFTQEMGKTKASRNPTLFLPFFPPHLSFPVKPGEQVWVFYDYVANQKIGYWLFRKSGYRQFDDVNFTVMERVSSIILQNDIFNQQEDSPPGLEDFLDVKAYSFPESPLTPYNATQIAAESVAYRREFIGEPVPRYTKQCGDLVLQGSNNTLISLGTDRSYLDPDIDDNRSLYGDQGGVYKAIQDSEDNDRQDDSFISQENIEVNDAGSLLSFKPELAGSIDLVVGRGINNLKDVVKELEEVDVNIEKQLNSTDNLKPNTQINPKKLIKKNVRNNDFEKMEYYEHNKGSEYTGADEPEDPNEGTFYGLNDTSARLTVSMRSNADMLRKSVKLGGSPADDHYDNVVRKKGGGGLSTILRSATTLQDYGRLSYDLSAGGANMHVGGEMLSISSGGAYNHLKDDGENELGSVGDGYLKIKPNGGVILHGVGLNATGGGIDLIESGNEPYVIHSQLVLALTQITTALTSLAAATAIAGTSTVFTVAPIASPLSETLKLVATAITGAQTIIGTAPASLLASGKIKGA